MKVISKAREPINSWTHLIGAVLAVIGTFLIVNKCKAENVSKGTFVTCLIFVVSMVLLYSASGVYHYVNGEEKKLVHFKRMDHAMIYVLIAGSYTPIIYALLEYPRSLRYILIIWGLAIAGIVLKMLFIYMPRWLGTLIYLAMGWFVVTFFSELGKMPKAAFALLLSGGISYTVGGVIYWLKKPNFLGRLGFHEVFHLFILLGSFLHYMLVYIYIA